MSAPSDLPRVSNLAELLRRAAERAPDRPAAIVAERRVSYAELDRTVDAVAAGLIGADLVAGFRVAIAMANTIEFVATYFGALRAGLVVVPLPGPAELSASGVNGPEEYHRVLEQVRARVIVADATTIDSVRAAVRGIAESVGSGPAVGSGAPLVVAAGAPAAAGEIAYDALVGPPTDRHVQSPIDAELLAVLLHTSSSGGRSRIAMLTHAALVAKAQLTAAIEPAPVRADDVVLGALPFCHVSGLSAVLGQAVSAGAAIVPIQRADAESTLRLIGSAGVTVAPVVPAMLSAWLDRPGLATAFAGVRLVLCGGAPLATTLAERFEADAGRTVQQEYGLTETAATVTSTLCSQRVKPGSVGRTLPGVELRVVDEFGVDLGRTSDGVDTPDPGEVLVKGPQLFAGYWPDGADGPDAAGWFATGDLGYLDADGDLFLIDRVHELISVSGFHVYPHEVESVIRELAAVEEAAVIAYGRGTSAEGVMAFAVPAAGATLDAETVHAHCRSRLARFKRPTVVEIVADLPRTAAGKIAKVRLWERTP